MLSSSFISTCHQILKDICHHKIFLRRCLHTTISIWTVFWMIYGTVITFMYADPDTDNEFFRHGYKVKEYFVCLWLTVIQYFYFSMYSVIDLFELFENNKDRLDNVTAWIHKAASFLMFSIIFPLSTVILVLFWGIYLWNRDMIYPDYMEIYFPQWLNHAMHTVPVPLSLLYMFTSTKSEPPKLLSCSGLVAFLSIYGYFLFKLKETEGTWVYIPMEMFSTFQNIVLYTALCLTSVAFLFFGYKLNDCIKSLRLTLSSVIQP